MFLLLNKLENRGETLNQEPGIISGYHSSLSFFLLEKSV